MSFVACYEKSPLILMEGAVGQRLKREFHLPYHPTLDLADIIYRTSGKEALRTIWTQYIDIAKKYHLPFMANTPLRRANKERVFKAGYDETIVLDNIRFLQQIRASADVEMFVGGCLGCKGDAYKATEVLQPEEALVFHSWQAEIYKQAGVDFLFAAIMPALPEAIGMARAMEQTALPYIISFMIRENGKLIDGTTINAAIARIDNSVDRPPICYMTNCVHPDVLYKALSHDFNRTELVQQRFRGIQPNTSALAPEALDKAEALQCADPVALAQAVKKLAEVMSLKIVGGCCGTDNRHIDEIAKIMTAAR
jgi:S-methylmethionine-dependent homocysteine/selenocysteine methylase